jgi:hypothetical protein
LFLRQWERHSANPNHYQLIKRTIWVNRDEFNMHCLDNRRLKSFYLYFVVVNNTFQLIAYVRNVADMETDSYITVLDTYTNLGPIVDFAVVDYEKQGQGLWHV